MPQKSNRPPSDRREGKKQTSNKCSYSIRAAGNCKYCNSINLAVRAALELAALLLESESTNQLNLSGGF